MKTTITLLTAAFSLFMGGCEQNIEGPAQSAGTNAATHASSIPQEINFVQPTLFPEGLAFDTKRNRFYVSSATFGTVGAISYDGTYTPVVQDEVLTGTTGLKLDRSNNRLFISNAANGIGVYSPDDGSKIFYTELASLLPDQQIFINDVAIDPEGNAYVTNSFAPVIYKVDRHGNASVLFYHTDFSTAEGDFGFNGIVYDETGFLLVAHTALGVIIKINLKDPQDFSVIQFDAPIIFPDGMLLSKNGRQLAVVSYDQVLLFQSHDRWSSAELISSFYTGSVFPTTLAADKRKIYVLYSHLDKLLAGEDEDTFTIRQADLLGLDVF